MINREFWKSKRVLLTGNTGFKGSWLSLWLNDMGASLFGYSLPPYTTPNLFESAGLASQDNTCFSDINDLPAFKKFTDTVQPEIVIHFAAQALVRESYKNPLQTLLTNVVGTANVLQAARESKTIKAILIITTDKVYENDEKGRPFKEEEPLGGYDPYSASKACAEIVTASWKRSFFSDSEINIATARSGNVIGGGDWSTDRLIPDIMESFKNNKPVVIRSPNSVRPWQHVMEPLGAYLLLAEKLYKQKDKSYNDAWNFGPEAHDVKTVKNVVEYLSQNWPGSSWSLDTKANPHEANLLMLDINKAKERLNWSPCLNTNQALEFTLNWYKQFYMNTSAAKQLCLEQIKRYEEILRERQ